MADRSSPADRRTFLKIAGALAATAASGCELQTHIPATNGAPGAERPTGFDRAILEALGEVVLPSELGSMGRDAAIGQFVIWADEYDPVAEEMHGYGYADIRYLPPDPSPAWRAQLAALELLAMKSHRKPFAALPRAEREELVTIAIRGHVSDRLPAPLDATHIAIALLAHWASSPDAWDLALGVKVVPASCRVLGDANAKPLPIIGLRS